MREGSLEAFFDEIERAARIAVGGEVDAVGKAITGWATMWPCPQIFTAYRASAC
jgi:hypothetical protein